MRAETEGFEREPDAYERGRPDYPDAVVDFVVETAGLGPGTTVVDLAAGTGKFTRQLVASGATVVAVEPIAAMRARLTDALPEVEAREATAEATGLPDAFADAVTVAQAFHWFSNDEAVSEIARVLRPGGVLALVWNRRLSSDPVQAAVSRLTAPFAGETPSHATGEWRRALERSADFEPVGECHLPMTQVVDRQGLVDRVGSISYIALLAEPARSELLAAVGRLAPATGTIPLAYETDCYCFRRR